MSENIYTKYIIDIYFVKLFTRACLHPRKIGRSKILGGLENII